MKFFALFLLFFSVSSFPSSNDKEEIRKLKITVEQLSSQLAEKTAENKRLSAAMKEMLSAQREGKKPVSGCDVAQYKKGLAFATGAGAKARASVSFLKNHGQSCTQSQLLEIQKEVRRLLYPADSSDLLRYYQQ
ncbi:hypothetical protein [Oceanicoccus sagamiensis]|uniref:Uncharacterized protein n=1 Tax=Oceanicoccus sagamiensis TaxID=716816 RepID=A0A1X9NH27_9GAMM|nr:hypothetical protein [Oceanicoccus sagamiensis]ARN73303.1 hypothetical protein BST96_03785 [Oceanicoccus sagamiensis]